MRTLFTTSEQLNAAKALIANYNNTGVLPSGGEKELWQAQKVISTCTHPDTGNTIFPLFRLSAYVPANLVIAGGMLFPGAGLANQVFWQFVNQTYNTALNFANRNATNPVTNQELTVNYLTAVSASGSIAVLTTRFAQRATFMTPFWRQMLLLNAPFIAVAASNIVNIGMMRRNELQLGINVVDKNGEVVGQSKIAGWRAVMSTAFVRIGCSLPLMTAVPVTMHYLGQRPYFMARPWVLNIPVNLMLMSVALLIGLPVASALFPAEVSISAKKLEPQFHNLVDASGEPISTLVYRRGL